MKKGELVAYRERLSPYLPGWHPFASPTGFELAPTVLENIDGYTAARVFSVLDNPPPCIHVHVVEHVNETKNTIVFGG